jgi:SAM-dependent methyltransferase
LTEILGIDIQQAKFLYASGGHGVSFCELATLGRQCLMASKEQLRGWLAGARDASGPGGIQAVIENSGHFAEPFWQFLGAGHVTSFDASDYEGATVVHDFNEPIPESYHSRFDTVVDSGSLEHIFNFPTAIRNLMQMVKPGGHLLIMTPANNFCGHGFYQFSPEVFYGMLGAANGYAVRRMLLAECFPDAYWWEVPDPAVIGRRVSFENRYWTHLFVIAQRVKEVEVLAHPQQTDYALAWNQSGADQPAEPESVPSEPRQTYWQRRRAKIWRGLQYRMLKYFKFHGQDRELLMKSGIFHKADGP